MSTPRHTIHLSALLLLFTAVLVGGCGSVDPAGTAESVDLDRLFAPPTEAEVGAVQAEWDLRRRMGAYEPGAVEVAFEELSPDGSRVAIISHTTGASSFRHYGAVRIPPGDVPEGGWPVAVFSHGGARGFDLIEILDRFATGALQDIGSQSVVVAPAFRSETMTNTPLGDLVSGGEPSIWNRDVDDALALYNAVLETYPKLIDGRSFATIGLSRGGAVALLMATRDPRVRAAVDYFGPMDFFGPSIRSIAELYISGTPVDVLAEDFSLTKMLPYMIETILQPLAEDTISYEEARQELVMRSSAKLARLLPNTIAHHHECDGLVPFEHFQSLQAAEAEISGDSEFYAYDTDCPDGMPDRRFHTLSERVMPSNTERTAKFLGQYAPDSVRVP